MKKIIFTLIPCVLFLTSCNKVDDVKLIKTPNKVIVENNNIVEGGECAKISPWGFPISNMINNQYLCHDGYALEYNLKTKTPNWLVNHVNISKIKNHIANDQEEFRPDPALKKQNEITLEDYAGTDFLLSQISSSSQYLNSQKETSQSYYLTNVLPMLQSTSNLINLLNYNVLKWSLKYDDLYIVSGPLYYKGQKLSSIGVITDNVLIVKKQGNDNNKSVASFGSADKGRLYVPTHYYKLIFSPKLKQVKAYLIPNAKVLNNDLSKYEITLNTLENVTGFVFFPQLPHQLKNNLRNMNANWEVTNF